MKSISSKCPLSTEVYFKAFISKECGSVHPEGDDYHEDPGYFTCGDASKLHLFILLQILLLYDIYMPSLIWQNLIIVGQYELNSAGTQACLVKSVTSHPTLSDACITPEHPALVSPAGSNTSLSQGFGKLIANLFITQIYLPSSFNLLKFLQSHFSYKVHYSNMCIV